MNTHKTLVLSVLLMFVAMLAAVPASADSTSFTLNYGNAAFCGGSSPSNCGVNYGTVNMQLNADNTITVSVALQNPYIMWRAGGEAFGFNSDVTGLSISIDQVHSTVGTGWSLSGPGSNQMDGFGSFQYVISNNASGSNLGSNLVFTVATTASGGFTSVNQLILAGDKGYAFAVHIADSPETGRVTGFAGTGPNPVPEPASMALIGSGLAVLGGYMRKRNSKR